MKKLILLLLVILSSCTSIEKQENIYIISLLGFRDYEICSENFKNRYKFGGSDFGRDMSEKIVRNRGWDWRDKIYLNWVGEGNVRFNYQPAINKMDEFMLSNQIKLAICELDEDDDALKYTQTLANLLQFSMDKSEYFHPDVLENFQKEIKESTLNFK
jgi:hypothetical protein